MDFVCSRERCSGCRTCEQNCPVNAITMNENKKGFIYPVIDKEKCVDCGKCQIVCPSLSVTDFKNPLKIYACKNKNLENRMTSSSGGTFTEICEYVFENNGTVFGAGFNKENNVQHVKASNLEELENIKTSKYVQSDMKDTYKKIKEDLLSGKEVLFSGTPCQVQSIKNCKDIDSSKVLYVDIVCHGVPSPKIFEEYKKYLEEEFNSKMINITFRHKNENTIKNMKIDFENGKTYISNSANGDIFYNLFEKDYILRDSCYNCVYKRFERVGDISLGDFWGYERGPAKDFGDNKGVSLVFINTKKGLEVFESIKYKLDYLEIAREDCIPYNCFSNFDKPKGFDELWKSYFEKGFEVYKNLFIEKK